MPAQASATDAAVTPLGVEIAMSMCPQSHRQRVRDKGTHIDTSPSQPSDSRIVTKRSIWDFGRVSRMRAGTSDCCRVTAKALASVSCRWWRLVDLHEHERRA